ncbi:MAG: transposase [Candidatus Peribacteraceae bacterium]|nr:transposase [Candidatus Peribacteraceae bacterium]MDD5739876.1 transposase [Candidatus Peribacteraceae bacterium]
MSQRHPVQNEDVQLITTVTARRMPVFADPAHAHEAIECLYRVQARHPFFLYGFVIMPDHCHFLLRVPSPQKISTIMNVFKSGMTFNVGIPKLWQARYHIRSVHNVPAALRYIRENPVKAGLAETNEEYPWSSASGKWDVTDWGL